MHISNVLHHVSRCQAFELIPQHLCTVTKYWYRARRITLSVIGCLIDATVIWLPVI